MDENSERSFRESQAENLNTQILDSEEGENVNQIYYDQEEIELNQEQQKKD